MKRRGHPRVWATTSAVLILLAACGQRGKEVVKEENPLFVDPESDAFSANPALLERLLSSQHGYFRFINHQFSSEVCRRFAESLPGTPSFNLHGDAHLEQYAVTNLGRGLTDFDDSTTGPAVIDLARLGVSLYLAGRQSGVPDSSLELLFNEFLRGYRDALASADLEAPEPLLVQRLRADFSTDRGKFFDWVGSVMEPMPETEANELVASLSPYVEAMEHEHREPEEGFFDVQSLGYLRLGIGSALDRKYLLRIAGPTDKRLDDEVLEIKQVRDLSGISCVSTTQRLDPFRILVGQSRIAYEPYRYLGYIHHQGRTFWIHAWVDNYEEIDLEDLFAVSEEAAQVVYDVGVQLGRGHPNQIASPLDEQLRLEQGRLLERDLDLIRSQIVELADLTGEAWEQFRQRHESS